MNSTSKKTSDKKGKKEDHKGKKSTEKKKVVKTGDFLKKTRDILKKKKKADKSHKEHSKDVDPREDLEDVDYGTECDVTIITPMIFGSPEDQPEAEERRRKEKEKKKKEEKRKRREARKLGKKPDDIINTEGPKDKKDKAKDNKNKKDDKAKGDKGAKEAAKDKAKEDLKGVPIISMSLGGKKGHPLENQIEGQMCLVANRAPGGELKLNRDKKYIFRFIGKLGSGYELIFTRDPIGGKKASILDGTGPIPIGEERLLVFSKECPDIIYYQERSRNCMGGAIRISNSS